ncbi:UDP-3-O-(3-hydroxymyristoyl)glucosamine N-acyltransferase [Leptospira perolatii]|uniref:UDP-3-O-(3-hydroxymyristoyl)glucosamine N-acyltransferase n=1 Tax=Leptospira perolatii TaxID=2023191 RepID=A0A2M9ZR24_9LEPT|nr:UDP-3-O-acyl-N-acetylglucosamine deacetylase [Leptospira perolatii]PJZ68383.1 UDP-3-O-(3-hydroxymyristoyl)glucosamine N-acyltransferase [Leptospira perolatii]PJZ74421.1 UDP-3-O-(3-hydroxymyristoyl)glucosamine N-acyltransferase [Leptospira perolatii]
MRIITKTSELAELVSDRNPKHLSLPESFRSDANQFDRGLSYTLQNSFTVEGKATFENKNSRIKVLPCSEPRSQFSLNGSKFPLKAELCEKGNHNIQLGKVKIIEHPLAWMLAFGMYAEFELEESSFPTFDYCDKVYLDGMKDNIKSLKHRSKIGVLNPLGIVWEKGYCILEPPQSELEAENLVIDHQVNYPGSTVGRSRLVCEFSPERFSYFADARTTAFRTKMEAEQFYQIGLAGGLKDYPFTLENVILLDEEKIYNPREKFFDQTSGIDFEFLCHEMIDISSWLRFVEEEYNGRYVGKMTTYLFDHHKQIDIAQFVCNQQYMKKFNSEIVSI